MNAVSLDGPGTGGAALTAQGVTKRYRRAGQPALDGVTLAVPDGSLTALVGPNGAGKSTLIRMWLGFERPNAGTVRVSGTDPAQDTAGALAQIGYVAQGGSLYRDLTVMDHLLFAASFRPTFDIALARERLDQIRIPLTRRTAELSGGQQAQVALAVAIATRAPILILDEPLASLDPLARREFMRALRTSVRSEGRTAVLSSHVVADVEDAADRLVLLIDGRVRLDVDTAEVLRSHAVLNEPTGDVVAAIPALKGHDRVLIRATPMSVEETASLEDVVMAYLIASKDEEWGAAF